MVTPNAAFTGSIPENYDRYLGPALFEPYARDIADRVKVAGDGAVLELACGTGIVTKQLRKRLPADTKLVATDLNEAMMVYAKQKFAADAGVEWKQADMMELPFPDESFNTVVCQFGIMFVPDKQKAFQEAHRVLKPGGGGLLFNVWDAMDHNDLGRVAHKTISSFFEEDPPNFYEIPFGFHDREAITSMLQTAGFKDVNFTVLKVPSVIPSAAEVSNGLVKGNPVIGTINERRPGDVDTIQRAVAEAVGSDFGDNPVRCSMQAIVFTAKKAK